MKPDQLFSAQHKVSPEYCSCFPVSFFIVYFFNVYICNVLDGCLAGWLLLALIAMSCPDVLLLFEEKLVSHQHV